jgi:hypothetical protein
MKLRLDLACLSSDHNGVLQFRENGENAMLTKMMAVVMMSGALWVAGDSLYREFGCCAKSRQCELISPTSDCCSEGSSDCCLVSRSACCAVAHAPAWQAMYVYCDQTEQVHFCEVTDGEYRCLTTGEILPSCCCTPLEN